RQESDHGRHRLHPVRLRHRPPPRQFANLPAARKNQSLLGRAEISSRPPVGHAYHVARCRRPAHLVVLPALAPPARSPPHPVRQEGQSPFHLRLLHHVLERAHHRRFRNLPSPAIHVRGRPSPRAIRRTQRVQQRRHRLPL